MPKLVRKNFYMPFLALRCPSFFAPFSRPFSPQKNGTYLGGTWEELGRSLGLTWEELGSSLGGAYAPLVLFTASCSPCLGKDELR